MALTMRTRTCALASAYRRASVQALRLFTIAQPVLNHSTRVYASRGTPADASSSAKDAQLAAAWHRNTTLLTTGGNLGLSQENPLHVFYLTQTAESTPAAGMLSFPLTTASSVQQLVNAAVPSPFGKGKETVYDPAVRTAVEIKAAQLALNKVLPPQDVLDEVRALLQPNASSMVAELDKLNIYGPGGFFKPHYDTPRSQDHFGTLIVCLPSPFKGGQLVVRHIDHNSTSAPHTRTYDWSSSGDTTTQDLRWAAFYTDTEHEVLPVTEGHRITLTYNLRAVHKQQWPATFVEPGAESAEDSKTDSGTNADQSEQEGAAGNSGSWMTNGDVSASAELAAELRRLMADKEWHNKGERLGFVLQQKYSAGLSDLAALSFPEALKGPDRLLAAALTQTGLKMRVVPLFRGYTGYDNEDVYQECKEDWADEEDVELENEPMVKRKVRKNFGRPLQPAQQREPLTTEPDAYWALLVAKFSTCEESLNEGYNEDQYTFWGEDTTGALGEVFGAREENICWVTPVLDEHFTYHGSVLAGANCAYEVCFNATAALLVDVPSWAKRQALLSSNNGAPSC